MSLQPISENKLDDSEIYCQLIDPLIDTSPSRNTDFDAGWDFKCSNKEPNHN